MDEVLSEGDLSLSAGALVEGSDLQTMVLLSLFSDAPAREGDPIKPGDLRKGYWADAYTSDGDVWGSRLWLLKRAKLTEDTAQLARQYVAEALAWMIPDGLASRIVPFGRIERINGVRALMFGADIYAPNEATPTRSGPWQLIQDGGA